MVALHKKDVAHQETVERKLKERQHPDFREHPDFKESQLCQSLLNSLSQQQRQLVDESPSVTDAFERVNTKNRAAALLSMKIPTEKDAAQEPISFMSSQGDELGMRDCCPEPKATVRGPRKFPPTDYGVPPTLTGQLSQLSVPPTAAVHLLPSKVQTFL